jgi:hypothetical protein
VFQRELERFAKRWNQMRSLRVFRDNANLAANPGLWSSIRAGIVGLSLVRADGVYRSRTRQDL